MHGTPKRTAMTAGQTGEALAQAFLEREGYRIIDVNVHFGKTSGVTGELDIVAWDGGTLCFIEVKTRKTAYYEQVPAAAVNAAKQRQLSRLATLYALQNELYGDGETPLRFDVVSVLLPSPKDSALGLLPDIQLIRGAFAVSEDAEEQR